MGTIRELKELGTALGHLYPIHILCSRYSVYDTPTLSSYGLPQGTHVFFRDNFVKQTAEHQNGHFGWYNWYLGEGIPFLMA
jgi:hypothetical protein